MKEWTEEHLLLEGYEIKNAMIVEADIKEDLGNYSFTMNIKGDTWGCNLPSAALCIYNGNIHSDGLEHMCRMMKVLGIHSLSHAEGTYVRIARKPRDYVKIVGNILEDKWFDIGTFYLDKGVRAFTSEVDNDDNI